MSAFVRDFPSAATWSSRDAEQAAAGVAPILMTLAARTDEDGAFPEEAIERLHEAGLNTVPLPSWLGGTGSGRPNQMLDLLKILKHVGRGNLAVGRLYEGHVNALQLIETFGSADQLEQAARDAAAGHLFGVWNTQAQDGVTLSAPQDGGHRLAGSKTFASGAGHVTRALVTAERWDGGLQMLVVRTDASAPAIDRSFWKPLGMRATASFRADFTGVRVAASDLLGPPDAYYRKPWFSGGAVRFAAVQLGGAEAVFDETRRFLRELGRTDDPYQRIRLGEMAMLVEQGNLWLPAAAALACDHTDVERVVAHAHLMRSAIEDICLRVMALAERCVGARGLLRPQPFERLHRDLTHYLRQPAPDAVLADAGRHVLERTQPAHVLWAE